MDLPDNLRSLGDLRSRYRRTRRGAQAGGVAFVFQGGGSLSAPQVGMLRALSEAGVVPDLVVGSSAGALNAVAFATDPTQAGLERLEAVWMSLSRRKVAQFSARTQVLGSVAATNVAAARGPVHVLPAPSSQTTSPVDFRDTSRLIDQGHQLAARWLASQRADRPASPDLPVALVAGAS